MSLPQDPAPSVAIADAGLLSPVRAGTRIEDITSDQAWLQAMLDAEAALARTQARLGTVPEAAARTITVTARADRLDLRDIALRARGAANPVVPLVEELTAAVAAVDADAAAYVHRGSTSQDVLDTAMMLVTARGLELILADVYRVADALAVLAKRHRGTLMAARTLGQQAVPTTFGLKAAGWLQGVTDAAGRLHRIAGQGLPVQLGGAAGTLAGYLEYAGPRPDAERDAYVEQLIRGYAAETGLAEPVTPWHTVRTPVSDVACALTFLCGILGKFALDVQFLARTEVGEVAERSVQGRGVSSAMPHKRNPALAALVRTASYQLPGLAAGLAQTVVADDERPAGAWHAEWQPLRECLRISGGAAHTAAELAEGLEVFPEQMRHNLDLTGGLVISERIAAVLTGVLGRAAAKQLLDTACAQSARGGRPLVELLAQDPRLAGKLTEQQWQELADPHNYTGAAGLLVDRALAAYHATRPCTGSG
ncbi:3-carboxy-cis,cis-muconate cycloisomerase [Streptomyces sp. NPDC127079]|uniref:3-carboxy-cis,cis-muconate cycloisomerase n=1 Tax=Streptomyces sp. NPDC127079 TaxID=3347132 RepID=UPI00365288CC